MKILVIVPSFNEEKSIIKTIEDLKANLSNEFDYVVIDDGSSDNTENLLIKNKINHITLPVNLGLSKAVQTGYIYAYENNYDAAVQFDGDGQHQAKSLELLKKEIEKGTNIAIGSRFLNKKKDHSLRMVGSRILSFLIKAKTGVTITDSTSGLRMIDKNNIYDYAYNANYRPEPDTLVTQIKKGYKIKEVSVEMNERSEGKSLYSSLYKSAEYMIRMIISILFIA